MILARVILAIAFAAAAYAAQQPPVYYLLWFDTEDYVLPAADDAVLKLATELERMGVRATFKVVGEKARVLERRGRRDVIAALARHDIGYHAENHSIPPAPSVYLEPLGLLEGAEEFERREGQGAKDVERIFGMKPSCYGQPGSSWGPQSNLALRRMGIPVYMDEATQVGLNRQPFWYGGLLYIFNLRQYSIRADLNDEAKLPDAKARFSKAVAELRAKGGGVIQTYYHPTEWVTTEFWDGVNFRHGGYTAPEHYRMPNRRTPASEAQAWRIFLDFIRHVQSTGVRVVTARKMAADHVAPPQGQPTADEARRQFRASIDGAGPHSAADLLLALLGIPPRYVDGPAERVDSDPVATIDRGLFERGTRDAVAFIERHGRLPSHVWFGSTKLSLVDFAVTLAADDGAAPVTVRKGVAAFERHIATDARRSFDWAIHPGDFAAPRLLELGRLQAWTLKPARLK
jgi:hypothetical protein